MSNKLENIIAESKGKFDKAFATIDQNLAKPLKLEDLQKKISELKIK